MRDPRFHGKGCILRDWKIGGDEGAISPGNHRLNDGQLCKKGLGHPCETFRLGLYI